jgi:heavy metal translocating P-type ATPase
LTYALATCCAALLVIVAGVVAGVAAGAPSRTSLWQVGLVVTGLPLAWRTLRGALGGRFATDLVATLAVLVAIVLGEPLAGLIVVVMQTGGETLEKYAEGRASNAVRSLEEAAPRIAHRVDAGRITDVAAADVAAGDVLLIRPGELAPCDAEVMEGRSTVDASRLTGEPVPVDVSAGSHLLSGSVNGGGALTVRALAPASESQYERIVQLVRTAQASKSPLQRLADRYAVWFTPITIAACAVTFAATRDWDRVLAVLVVATPCPLILAAPIAVIGGINRAARRQIVIRTGGALEQLGQVTTAMFDKTGTLTLGRPRVSRVVVADGFDAGTVLQLAGALEQHAAHPLARSVVEAAVEAAPPGAALAAARHVAEAPGRGVEGRVDGHLVTVGARSFVTERQPNADAALARLDRARSGLRACVAIDGAGAGIVEFADRLRDDVPGVLADLRALGVTRILLLSGDHGPNAHAVARAAGIDEARGDLSPDDKVRFVHHAVARGERVLMVGDGTNDAPALSAATVGVALAAHGGGISAEAAHVVVLSDDLSRVADAMRIGRRTMRIARQSIWIGLGLSAAAMVLAAFGYIRPTVGAALQEVVDVAVIFNALRASGGGRHQVPGASAHVRPVSEPCQTTCQAASPAAT